jgi:hypothetical protein
VILVITLVNAVLEVIITNVSPVTPVTTYITDTVLPPVQMELIQMTLPDIVNYVMVTV